MGQAPRIIAEAGVNHNGSMETAEKIIIAAKKAGAWAVKWQTYTGPDLVLPGASKFWSWDGDKHHEDQLGAYTELGTFGVDEYLELKRLSDKHGVEFMSTPFSVEAVEMLGSIGMKYWKIASCDIATPPILEAVNKVKGKKLVLLSTGSSHMSEISQALTYFTNPVPLCIMHCNLEYPTKAKDANLGAIWDIYKTFVEGTENCVGYSDHTLGVEVAAASVMYGASYIEKHFTIDKSAGKSADHWLSADPDELKNLVDTADILAVARGWCPEEHAHDDYKFVKWVQDGELLARSQARRSIVTSEAVKAGEPLAGKLTMKRPLAGGISGYKFKKVSGMVAAVDMPANFQVTQECLK